MDFESFIIASNQAQTPEEAYALFARATASFGYEQGVYCFLSPHADIGIKGGLAVASNYPDEWVAHYLQNEYMHIDPMIPACLGQTRPFEWAALSSNDTQRKVVNESVEFGLHNGLAIPIHSTKGEVAAIGLAAKEELKDRPTHIYSLLHAYAQQFHHVYTSLLDKRERPRIELSTKEREVLHRLADGKTLADIGEIMCLSEDAIRYYVKALYTKLGANQRTQAVVKAIGLGLLNPYRVGL